MQVLYERDVAKGFRLVLWLRRQGRQSERKLLGWMEEVPFQLVYLAVRAVRCHRLLEEA